MYKFSISDTKNGFKTISVISSAGKEIKLHSSYDPIKEAERNIDTFDKGRSSIIIVSGVALGYHIKFLKEKYPDIKIVAVEKEKEIQLKCNEYYPETLSDTPVINSLRDIESIFSNIDLPNFKGIAHYIHKPSYQLNQEFYDEIADNIKLYISSRISDLLTRFEFEEKWIENIFKNLKHIEHSTDVAQLFGKFRDIPGVIVSAGPSLKNNVEELKKIKDKAVIVAVDTSLKILANHNIEPHFVLTLDAQKHSIKHFSGIKPKNTILIADIVSCPSILNSYNGEKIISTTSKYYQDPDGNTIRETTPMIDWIEKKSLPLGDIQSGGSVSTSAFDLLLNMGCNPVILVGQDLAYTGREYHCSGTYHNDDWIPGINRFLNLDTINQNIIRKRSFKYVRSYGGKGLVISDYVFDLYKSWFEDSAGRVPVTVVNSSGGGAKVNNTTEMSLYDGVNLGKKNVNPSSIIEKIISNKTDRNIDRVKKALAVEYKKLNLIDTSDNLDDNTMKKINSALSDDETNELLRPLMRKTEFYLARHEFEADKERTIFFNDIKLAVRKVKKFIESSGMIESEQRVKT
ncbi:MAG: DUF115 domain-containing protein [Spirochaetes bacterium]|nr:DUF115 domain-containing protein [Spirochaetota bacterium]